MPLTPQIKIQLPLQLLSCFSAAVEGFVMTGAQGWSWWEEKV